jgi:hypothetical protein
MAETQRSSGAAVVACSLDGADMAKRAWRWSRLRARAGRGRAVAESGLCLRFGDEPGVERELRRLAELERACCAFATWDVERRDRELVLDIGAASPEGRAAVRTMFRDR